jgi:hypothetical protein
MGDAIDTHRAIGAHHKAMRAKHGKPCPECATKRPRANPSILLPQQRCRVDGYVDPRPDLTDADHQAVADQGATNA